MGLKASSNYAESCLVQMTYDIVNSLTKSVKS